MKHDLGQKLIQVQGDGEAMKRKLEGEITRLIRDRDRLQEELKRQHFAPAEQVHKDVELKFSPYETVAEVRPQNPTDKSEVEQQLTIRVSLFGEAGRSEAASMEAAAAAMNAQFAIESRRPRMKLEEAQHDTEALTGLRDALKEQVAELEKQIDDADSLSQAERRQNMGTCHRSSFSTTS
jgi:hypothetical protein